jgi:hypothetical protein
MVNQKEEEKNAKKARRINDCSVNKKEIALSISFSFS